MKAGINLAPSLAAAAAAARSCVVNVSSTIFYGVMELLSHHLPSAILPTDEETRAGDDHGDESCLCRDVKSSLSLHASLNLRRTRAPGFDFAPLSSMFPLFFGIRIVTCCLLKNRTRSRVGFPSCFVFLACVFAPACREFHSESISLWGQ